MKPYQAVFLDRDGTIIKDVGHLTRKEDVELLPGAVEIIKRINELDILALMVTNQSVIGNGLLTREQLIEINNHMQEMLHKEGAEIDGAFWCPHKPEDNCFCRKPKPGMLYTAAVKFQLDLRRCIVVGDALADIQAAKAVRAQWFKVKKGLGEWRELCE